MKSLAFFAVAVLVCAVVLPPAFSDDDYEEKDGNKMHFGYSNQTISFGGYTNKTVSFGFSNQTNIGQLISDYVHQRNAIEKQQRNDILSAVKACSQVLAGSNNTAKQQCKAEIMSIRDQFRSELLQLDLQFKQFRESIIPQGHDIETPEKNEQVMHNVMNNVMNNVSHARNHVQPKHIEDNKNSKNSHHH